jgi:hypothetical protein
MLMEGGVLFFAPKTPRIYNRLAFVNTIAQVFHTRGIVAKYKPLPSQVSHNRTRQLRQPTSSF